MAYDWVNQEEIFVDDEFNMRAYDQGHIHDLARHINKHGYDEGHPCLIAVIREDFPKRHRDSGKKYLCVAGHHRIHAMRLQADEYQNLPCKKVYAEILGGANQLCTFKFASRRMLIDNFMHTPGFNSNVGKMPTRDELRDARYNLLFFTDFFEKGDRLLAKEWGCDHKTISKIREEVILSVKHYPSNLGDVDRNDNGYPPPSFVSASDIDRLRDIVDKGLFIGEDGKKYPRSVNKSGGEKSPPEGNSKSDDREANKEVNQKTSYFKQIWDLRKDVAKTYIGEGQTDLNQYTNLVQLEKKFAKLHDYCADAFRSAMKRTSYATYQDALNRTLESDVSVDDLVQEYRAISTYAADIRTWNGTTDASQWIRILIAEGKKRSQSVQKSTGESAEEDDKPLVAEWNSEWLPQIADLFILYGMHSNSVRANIGRAIKKEFGDEPYSLSDEDMSQLISDAKIITEHPQRRGAWHRTDDLGIGHTILWADSLLLKARKSTEENSALDDKQNANRKFYARITHHNADDAPFSNKNEIYFYSPEDRLEFQKHFEEYHASHEHDGDPPTFDILKASELNAGEKSQAKEAFKVDLGGWYEAEKETIVSYFEPTCLDAVDPNDGVFATGHLQGYPLNNSEEDQEEDAKSVLDLPGLREEFVRLFTLHSKYDLQILNSDKIAEKFPDYERGDVDLACALFRTELVNLERGIIVDMENEHVTVADLKEKYSDYDEEVVVAMICKVDVDNMKDDDDSKTLDQWKSMVKDQIKFWKSNREGVGYASLTMFLHATMKFHSLPHTAEITEDIYDKLMTLLTTKYSYSFEQLIRKQLRGENLWSDHRIVFINVGFDVGGVVPDDILLFSEEEEDGDFALSEIPDSALNEIWQVLKRVYPAMQDDEDNEDNEDDKEAA